MKASTIAVLLAFLSTLVRSQEFELHVDGSLQLHDNTRNDQTHNKEIQDLQQDQTTGWRTIDDVAVELLGLDLEYCTLDRIPAQEMTKERFQKEYLGRKPVVISNMTDNWVAHTTWNKTYFIEKFGQRTVEVDATSVFQNYGGSTSKKLLAEYIHHEFQNITLSRTLKLAHKTNPRPLSYSFSNFDDGYWNEMMEDTPTPPLFEFIGRTKGHVNQLAVGATGTGLSWHSHHDAWNSVIVGKKLWLIADPSAPAPAGTGLFSADDDPHCCSALNWHTEEVRRRKESQNSSTPEILLASVHAREDQNQSVGQCVVHSGEAVYVPARWTHATMNIGDTIARSQRGGSDDMSITLKKYAQSIITFDLDHHGRFGVKDRKEKENSSGGSGSGSGSSSRIVGKEVAQQRYMELTELLDRNALELICDTNQEYAVRIGTFKYMTSIVKKLDRALKTMRNSMKTTMPSTTRKRELVRKFVRDSDLILREFKTDMGTCYIKDLYRRK